MSSCMWISIRTEPTPTFGWEPSSDRLGGDESEENDSFAVWERREGVDGRAAETGGLSQQHKDGDYTSREREPHRTSAHSWLLQ